MKAAFFHWLHRDWILGCVLFVVTLISYKPAWNGTPIWDDERHITSPELRSMDGLARIWTRLGATQQYYPLMHSVFWLEYRLWGDLPFGYHIVNILLHMVSAFLLVKILRLLRVPGAWLVGSIFALHPVQVESVAWITELKNTLSGVFFFLTALVYLSFDRERTRGLYAKALVFFILGLMSKSVIATLPVSLLALFWWKRGTIAWKNDILPLLPFFALGIASGLFTAWVEHTFIISQEVKTFTYTFIERSLIAGRVFWFYLSTIILPLDLMFIYPRWNINQAVAGQYFFPAAAGALAVIVWSLRRRWRAPLAAFIYFTATLFPVLGFINLYPFRYSFVADHFQYLACVAPLAMAVAGIVRAFKPANRFLKLAACVTLLATLGILTWKQSGMYADIETLYRTTIRKNPQCSMAHHNLGALLVENGRIDEAMFHYRKSIEINPDFAESWHNLGKELLQAGQTDEAMAYLLKALEINPNFSEAHNTLGALLERIGRTDEAVAHYRKALEINPNNSNAHNNLGTLLAGSGQTDEAVAHLRKALEINPAFVEAYNNLGILFDRIGRTAEAIPFLEKAHALAKSSGDESLAQDIENHLDRLHKESTVNGRAGGNR